MTAVPANAPASVRPRPVSLREAVWVWLRIAMLSFGGPAGQIAVMHRILVNEKRWIGEQRFLHALNYCMLLPGPEAQQLATYLGWLLHRTWGGILAGVLFVLPSLFILVALAWLYMAHGDAPAVAGFFHGIQPAVTAIVVQAAVRIGSRSLRNGWLWSIAVGAFVALFAFDVPFPAIVASAAVLGSIGGRMRPAAFGAAVAAAPVPGEVPAQGRALIDDDTPVPAHARFSWRRACRVLLVGAGLWLLAIGALWAAYGGDAVLVRMAWFFTKAALMTFGGAYAVLPYVYQGAVEHFQWITPAQMMDGLALGETTPGPLIMVVSFVAFVGGWARALFGPEALPLAGATAAAVVTFFTFLPSFVFILLGGPFIESTRGNLRFAAPLAGIAAAVVGVIANLAVFFALHVFWPQGLPAGPDVRALLIGLAAAMALMRWRVGVVPVILAAGLAGLVAGL